MTRCHNPHHFTSMQRQPLPADVKYSKKVGDLVKWALSHRHVGEGKWYIVSLTHDMRDLYKFHPDTRVEMMNVNFYSEDRVRKTFGDLVVFSPRGLPLCVSHENPTLVGNIAWTSIADVRRIDIQAMAQARGDPKEIYKATEEEVASVRAIVGDFYPWHAEMIADRLYGKPPIVDRPEEAIVVYNRVRSCMKEFHIEHLFGQVWKLAPTHRWEKRSRFDCIESFFR